MAEELNPNYWLQGGCAEYALALQERNPELQFGRQVIYDEPDEFFEEGDYLGYSTNHVFVHDATTAYDALGAHPLPYEIPGHTTLLGFPREDVEGEWDNDAEMVAEAHRQIEQGITPIKRDWNELGC